VARLNNLSITGSIGILIRAKKEGYSFSIEAAIERMRKKGIRLSERVIKIALEQC
jgi:predicted nucleic acid-binding protein